MDKKGFLIEKAVLELVLTIIGILLILSVMVYAFGLVSTAQVKRNAQTSLDILESRANSLQEGKNVVAKLPGLCKGGEDKSCDWFIAGWSKTEKDIPEQHLLKNVVCVCKGQYEDSFLRARACQNIDSCREIKEASSIIIQKTSFKEFMTDNEGRAIPSFKDYPVIGFESNLIQVEISKSNGVVSFKKV